MRKHSYILLLVIVVVVIPNVIISCAVRKSEPIKKREFIPANERIVNGEKLYMANCQKCHPAGEGGLALALNQTPGFVKRLQARFGLGVMPRFSAHEIPPKDLRDISKYLKAWKHY